MGAMRSQMNTNLRNAKMKERMQEKLKQRQMERMQAQSNNTTPSVFSTGEVVEKSMRGDQDKVNNKKKKTEKRRKTTKKINKNIYNVICLWLNNPAVLVDRNHITELWPEKISQSKKN